MDFHEFLSLIDLIVSLITLFVVLRHVKKHR